jgi:hypothetical protein
MDRPTSGAAFSIMFIDSRRIQAREIQASAGVPPSGRLQRKHPYIGGFVHRAVDIHPPAADSSGRIMAASGRKMLTTPEPIL